MTTRTKPRRRWFQFSLRTLFVLVAVVGVGLALTVNAARKQREAVAAIKALRGYVRYEHESIRRSSQEPPGPEWLRELVGEEYFVTIISVSLKGTQITDNSLEHLEGLTSLRRLYLDGTTVTDEGVKKLQKALPNCAIFRP